MVEIYKSLGLPMVDALIKVKNEKQSSKSKKNRLNIDTVIVGQNLEKLYGKKVLIVDDNAVNLKVAQGLLKTFNLTVDTCKSGRECLELMKKNRDYDLVFLDHMMPELDGIETLNLIRADSDEYMKKVPIVALTANVMNGVRDMFISEGFNDYVPKPIDMVWVNSILRKYIPIEKQS